MKVTIECVPCYLKQMISAYKQLNLDQELQWQVMNTICDKLSSLSNTTTPAYNSSLILHQVVKELNMGDPFKIAKERSNEQADQLLNSTPIDLGEDPLFTALKLAAAGNIIDLGIIEHYNLQEALYEALNKELAINDYPKFKTKLKKQKSVLILADNSGEIAFDKILVQELIKQGCEVTYAVKGGFILNDATYEDAKQVGMDKLTRVIDNGNNFLGTILDKCSKAFIKAFERADLIISKGQANFETLEGTKEAGEKTFFLVKVKCEIVAKNLNCKAGDTVFVQNKLK